MGLPGLIVPPLDFPNRVHVFHQYTVRVTDDAPIRTTDSWAISEGGTPKRDVLQAELELRGISSGIYYPRLVHDYDCFRGRADVIPGATPRSSLFARQVLSLPVHPHLAESELDFIIEAIRSCVGA